MNLFDRVVLLATGLVALYAIWQFYDRYRHKKALHMPQRKIAVPLVHGVAGLIIFLLPIRLSLAGKVPAGFWWVGIGGMLIGIGGIALAFLVSGAQLLFFDQRVVLAILAPLLFLMTAAYVRGFMREIQANG